MQELSAIPSDEMYVLLRDFNTPLSREALAKNDWFQAKAEEEEKTRFGGKDVGGVSRTYSHVGVGLDHLDLLLSVMKIVVHALPALHNNNVGLHCKSFGVLDTPNPLQTSSVPVEGRQLCYGCFVGGVASHSFYKVY